MPADVTILPVKLKHSCRFDTHNIANDKLFIFNVTGTDDGQRNDRKEICGSYLLIKGFKKKGTREPTFPIDFRSEETVQY